ELKRLQEDGAAESIAESVRLERMLANEGILLLKFWFHVSKQQQKKRLKSLEKDPRTRWRVRETEWQHHKSYDLIRATAEYLPLRTTPAEAPWFVVAGAEERYRNLTVANILVNALRQRLDQSEVEHVRDQPPPPPPSIDQRNILRALDYSLHLSKAEY